MPWKCIRTDLKIGLSLAFKKLIVSMLRKSGLNDMLLSTENIIQQPTNQQTTYEVTSKGIGNIWEELQRSFERKRKQKQVLRIVGLQEMLTGVYLNTCLGYIG